MQGLHLILIFHTLQFLNRHLQSHCQEQEASTSSLFLFIACLFLHSVLLCLVAQSSLTICEPMDCRLLSSWGFSKQEYWSVLLCLPPGDLPNLEIKPGSPALQADSLSAEPPGKSYMLFGSYLYYFFYFAFIIFWFSLSGELLAAFYRALLLSFLFFFFFFI